MSNCNCECRKSKIVVDSNFIEFIHYLELAVEAYRKSANLSAGQPISILDDLIRLARKRSTLSRDTETRAKYFKLGTDFFDKIHDMHDSLTDLLLKQMGDDND